MNSPFLFLPLPCPPFFPDHLMHFPLEFIHTAYAAAEWTRVRNSTQLSPAKREGEACLLAFWGASIPCFVPLHRQLLSTREESTWQKKECASLISQLRYGKCSGRACSCYHLNQVDLQPTKVHCLCWWLGWSQERGLWLEAGMYWKQSLNNALDFNLMLSDT